MSEYKTTVGLEIHAELNTQTKMFCKCKNDSEEKRPNVNICPICMAHPGTLPVINKEAVKHVLRVGRALGAEIADFTEFDRKNYFYPDIPKGYQISQYKYPLVSGGKLAGVAITRVHLEEDTARSSHTADENGGFSLVDFNRAGLPLMELVTEPVIHDAQTAGTFARELQLLFWYLGISHANMEKGEMRVEANISVSKTDEFGTKVEVKNLNSFRSVERAIEYEVSRHIALLDSGGTVVQETRGWDESGQKTYSQRSKENAQEYRYFPDPDLPKLKLSEVEEFQNVELPELPWQKRERFDREYGIKPEDREVYIYDQRTGNFFEGVAKELGDPKRAVLASNYITSDIAGLVKQHPAQDPFEHISQENFAALIRMAADGDISSRGAKDILAIMFVQGGDPKTIADDRGLLQKSDEGELKTVVEQIILENEKVVSEYKAGKEASLQFLIGQGMRMTRGSANPQVLKKLFEEAMR